MALLNYIDRYLDIMLSYPFVIRVAMIFILINVFAALIFFATLYFTVRNRKKLDKEIKTVYPEQRKFFSEILDSQSFIPDFEIHNQFVEKFGKLNNRSYIPAITSLQDLVKENPDLIKAKNYRAVIDGLKIDRHLEKRLDFSSTRERLRTFQTLSILDLTISDSKILPHTYSRNVSLKKESRNSYVGISSHDPFKFFEHTDNNINYWDQINLIKQLEIHHKNHLPNFSKWIKYSKNISQQTFIIKAVAYFKQKSSIPALIELLDTPDHTVRKEVISALGTMQVEEIEDRLISIYHDQPQACQDAIVEALYTINSGNCLEFLKEAYTYSSNMESKKLIAEVIYRYNEAGKHFIETLSQQEDGFEKLILEHVKNPLIPSRLSLISRKTAKDYADNLDNLSFSI